MCLTVMVSIYCSSQHVDFSYIPSSVTYQDPTYVPSPYGAWLAFDSTPSDDTTSDWFREVTDLNHVIDDTIILRGKSLLACACSSLLSCCCVPTCAHS